MDQTERRTLGKRTAWPRSCLDYLAHTCDNSHWHHGDAVAERVGIDALGDAVVANG